MNKIVLDTNILIDSAHGYAPWVRRVVDKSEKLFVVIPTIVIAEYLTAEEHNIKIHNEKSKEFLQLFNIQDLTSDIAQVLGTILRRKTHLISASMADLIIAATTIYLGAELATRNKKDFAKIPGLRFFDPKSLA